MSVPVKSKTGSRNARRRNLIITSLLIVVLFSSVAVYMFVTNSDSDGAIHVKTELELVQAINDAEMGVPVIITLDNDIELTLAIKIPAYKDITLRSNGYNEFKLLGTDYVETLIVQRGGVLKLDGIIVTHAKDAVGCGVCILAGGELYLHSGAICGNTASIWDGGGVCNSGDTFIMYGGEISNNTAQDIGGGVANGGLFEIHGGKITNNIAITAKDTSFGGGVYNYPDLGTFNKLGGDIYNNTAERGNDVYPP